MKTPAIALLILGLLASSCGPRSEAPQRQVRHFPRVELPTMVSDPEESVRYVTEHYWDAFLDGTGVTDSGAVKGVPNRELEQAVSSYVALLSGLPKAEAQGKVAGFLGKIEEAQLADTASHVFPLLTQMVVKYLYDPNSPMRDEDLYLPFAQGLAVSPLTDEDSRPGYAFEARMCSLAQYGTVAPDFDYVTAGGKRGSLHGIKAQNTLIFFSNPGCGACKDIIEALGRQPFLEPFIQTGRLAVLNLYIDSELDKWRDYLPSYPESWISAYDPAGVIREDALYNVRAIPSLYLLDADKKVVLKDAPVERVIQYLSNH